ncbi:MAG: CPBP family intramembrane metalloprotease, partial [Alphaproteobacteria bacterium]|nr:CPBP family intramembrane metalloprotease [Alphaproteobacteria bacterium]
AMRGTGMLLASLGVAAGASAAALVFIRASGLPLARFGLTLARWPSALGTGLVWSLGMCAALTGVKLALITWLPAWQGLPLWAPGPGVTLAEGAGVAALLALAYLASSLVQEFASRVFLQTSLELVLQGPRASAQAVLLSNALFSVFHLHYSTGFALLTFGAGLVYGALWVQRRSIVAVTVLHFITGMWALDLLGLMELPGVSR